MDVKFIKIKGTWRDVADSCNTTIGKDAGDREPSSHWKRRILLSEHSPIRQISLKWKWIDIPYFVSVHLVRHWLGIIHWVKTQRSDRTGIDRTKLPQDNPVTHECEANAQSIINISRRRLCNCASIETREAWSKFLNSFKTIEPELFSVCVKDCVYRGFCAEFYSCNYHKTESFTKELIEYRKNINS